MATKEQLINVIGEISKIIVTHKKITEINFQSILTNNKVDLNKDILENY